MVISIRLMSGPQDGQRLSYAVPTTGKPLVLTLGRMETCDVALPYDGQVSRKHAQLICVRNDETMVEGVESTRFSLTLQDLGSRNGTFVGEERLGKGPVRLVSGELFRIGRTWLRVEL